MSDDVPSTPNQRTVAPLRPAAAERGTTPKLAEGIAADIKQHIEEMGWSVGVTLGSEASLRERFGGSRNTFREAVRILEQQGLAWMRKGPRGGLVVTVPELTHVLRSTSGYLRFRHVDVHQLLQTRIVLECSVVEQLAANLSAENLNRIQLAMSDEECQSPFDDAALHRFHVALAALAGNGATQLFLEMLIELQKGQLGKGNPSGNDRFAQNGGNRAVSFMAHRAIAEAIIDGDASLAHRRMRRHLEEIDDHLRAGSDGPAPGTTTIGQDCW